MDLQCKAKDCPKHYHCARYDENAKVFFRSSPYNTYSMGDGTMRIVCGFYEKKKEKQT